MLEQPGRAAEEVLRSGQGQRLGFSGSNAIAAYGQGLLSTARPFYWPHCFGRTLVFPAVKRSFNSRLGAEIAS